ncbi:MAG: DUF2589 domain-containing protein [Sandaracinaceae bacterium]|nr:DUF2589 domain-containing protein [Sandaracinaceae bacterium]
MPVIDTFTPREFGEVLGSLLTSVVDAQARAARATVDFIEDVGLETEAPEGESERRLRMVSFEYTKLGAASTEAPFRLDVPLLGLVQIPMIVVKTARFEFEYDVQETGGSKASGSASNRPVPVKGRIARARASTTASSTSGLKVVVELEQASPSVGIERLLEILELAATDTELPLGTSDGG